MRSRDHRFLYLDYAGNPQTGALTVVGLTEYADDCRAYFFGPSARHIAVSSQKYPSVPTTFGNHLRIAYILPLIEMVIMYNNAKTGLPQFCGQVFSPEIPVCKEDRIRRQSM